MRINDQPNRCDARPPEPCLPRGGFLMQQIIGAGRVYLRYERFTLMLSDLPCDARPPFALCGVTAQECGVRAVRCEDPCRRGVTLRVEIPLLCAVNDACGAGYTARSSLDIPVPMRLYDPREADRAQAVANAFVRLARPCGRPDGCAAEAWLDVCAEAWLTACRPMFGGACPPACPPPLPLYPQPCRPR